MYVIHKSGGHWARDKMTDCSHCHLYFFVIVLMFLEIVPLTVGYGLTVLLFE